jgi:hypothetical protein
LRLGDGYATTNGGLHEIQSTGSLNRTQGFGG